MLLRKYIQRPLYQMMKCCSRVTCCFWIIYSPLLWIKNIRQKRRKFSKVLLGMLVLLTLYLQFDWLFVEKYALHPCQLPFINSFDRSLEGVFHKMPDVNCKVYESPATINSSGYINLDRNVYPLNEHFKQPNSTIRCSYAEVHPDGVNAIKLSTQFRNMPSSPSSDFVVVTCTNGNRTIFRDVKYKIKMGGEKVDMVNETDEQLSILIFGLESVSRLVAENKIPKTLAYFKNELGSYDFEGFTKVGDNTLPNLLAALSGQTLLEALVPTFDYPPLFRDINHKGYVSCYGEDWIPYLPPLGFKYPDYTHNLREYFLAGDEYPPFVLHPTNFQKLLNRKDAKCLGNSFKHDTVIDFADKFVRAYDKRLKYSFTWINEIGHHESNFLDMADERITYFFENLNKEGKLNRTVIILMGDHGPRYGKAMKKDLVRFTGRLPMLHIVLPKHIRQRYPYIDKNLKTNIKRLTSPFDLYETLNDVVFQNYKEASSFKSHETLPRGISLFREIPKSRSCYEASISEHYCPCYSSIAVPVTDVEPNKAADFMVSHIQKLLSSYKTVCSEVSFEYVKSASLQSNHDGASGTNRYVIVFSTSPGAGIYEGTVDVTDTGIKLLGDINRLTAYGNTADCIQDTVLKLYCYCKSNVSKT